MADREITEEEYQTIRAARAVQMGIDNYVKEKGVNTREQVIINMMGPPTPRWNFFQWILFFITFVFALGFIISLGGNH